MKIDDFIIGWSGGLDGKTPELIDLWEDACEIAWDIAAAYLDDIAFWVKYEGGFYFVCWEAGEEKIGLPCRHPTDCLRRIPYELPRFRPLAELIGQDLERWLEEHE